MALLCFSGETEEGSHLPVNSGLCPFKTNLREDKWEEGPFYTLILIFNVIMSLGAGPLFCQWEGW